MKKKFWLGVLIGALGCLAVLGLSLAGMALYVHANPGNTYVLTSEHITTISIVRAPEQLTRVQTNELLKLNAQVLDAALDLEPEEARMRALSVWTYRLIIGCSPYERRPGELPVAPQSGEEL